MSMSDHNLLSNLKLHSLSEFLRANAQWFSLQAFCLIPKIDNSIDFCVFYCNFWTKCAFLGSFGFNFIKNLKFNTGKRNAEMPAGNDTWD